MLLLQTSPTAISTVCVRLRCAYLQRRTRAPVVLLLNLIACTATDQHLLGLPLLLLTVQLRAAVLRLLYTLLVSQRTGTRLMHIAGATVAAHGTLCQYRCH
jgi:hypothetical protein